MRAQTQRQGVEIKLAQFEGPLDLLLHLIERAELDIAEIFVSDITAQYMALMQQAEALDMERASSFLQMAATLLYIKSRALLPQKRQVAEEEEDPEAALIRQIHEYKICKQAAEELVVLGEVAVRQRTRLPEEYPLPPPKVLLTDVPVEELYAAFMGLLLKEKARENTEQERKIERDLYSISDGMEIIRGRISRGKRERLDALFPKDGGRLGIIVVFMALLELLNKKEAVVWQEENFGMIEVEKVNAG